MIDINGFNICFKYYLKFDRLYGIKWFMVKLLYVLCCCKKIYLEINFGCICIWICNVWLNFFKRFIIFMWLFVLLLFGLYRIIVRFNFKKMYNNYYIVVRISELMFYLIVKFLEDWVFVLDSIYVMFCLIIYVYFG